MTLTFKRYIPRQGREKERMEIEVARAGQAPFMVYPKMFMNQRTRQMMVNPDIKSSPFQDLYVSPIEFDPGQPRMLQLAKGQSGAGRGRRRCASSSFNLDMDGNALVAMQEGRPVTIGAELAVTRGGKTLNLTPVYRLNAAHRLGRGPAHPPPRRRRPSSSPGSTPAAAPCSSTTNGVANPAKLSIDVTKKPLIQLVWGGLYVVLIGGILTLIQRFRQMRVAGAVGGVVEALRARPPAGPPGCSAGRPCGCARWASPMG